MEAVDTSSPSPERAIDQPFLMPIEDVFTDHRPWHRRSRAASSAGSCTVNDEVEIIGIPQHGQDRVHGCGGCSASCSTRAAPGDNIGALLRGTKKEEVERVRCSRSRAASRRTRTSRPRFMC
jgi:elongation factor Tu